MKTIERKKVKEQVTVNGRQVELELDTLDLIETAVNAPTKGGMTASDMHSRIKILDAVRDCRNSPDVLTEISLEDVDYKKLTECVIDCKWSIVSRTILDFVKQFEKNN